MTARQAYGRLGEGDGMSYPVFHERLQKLEFARLVDLFAVRKKERAQVILVREGWRR